MGHNADIASKHFEKRVGELKVGGFADMILVDYDPPTAFHAGNFPWHLIFGMFSPHVDTTIVGGKVLMEGRDIKSVNVAEVMKRCRERAPEIWERF